MSDRGEEDDVTAEALAKAREILGSLAAEVLPLLDNLAPIGRGDGEAALPNSLRIIVLLFEAADARHLLTAGGAVSERTLRRISRGEHSPRAARTIIDALVDALVTLGRQRGAPEAQVAAFQRQGATVLDAAARRWDALAETIGDAVRPEHAASIVLRVAAVDVGVRLAVLRRVAQLAEGPWVLFEPRPLAHAIDKLVLPSLGLDLSDVHCETDAQDRAVTHRWARSTLSRWRLEGAIPEPEQLDEFARDLVEIAHRKRGKAFDTNATVAISRALRAGRAASVVRRVIAEAFPDGHGERLIAQFLSAVKLVESAAHEVFTNEGLVVAWGLAQTIVPPDEAALVSETGESDEGLMAQAAREGLTHDQVITFVRLRTIAALAQRDPKTMMRVRDVAAQSLISFGAAAPEAVVVRELIARSVPESGLRIAVERLDRDPRRAVLDQVLLVAFIETIAEGAGDLRESLLAKATECAAILPDLATPRPRWAGTA